MKELRIPTKTDDYVDMSAINRDFKGLVIGYNNDKAVGYIQYNDDSWYFLNDIDLESGREESETPFELITYLIKYNKCTHFKVIEFV